MLAVLLCLLGGCQRKAKLNREERARLSSNEEARLIEIPFPPHTGIEIIDRTDNSMIFACHSLLKESDLNTYFPRELQRVGWHKKASFMSDEEFLWIYEKPMSLITIRSKKQSHPLVYFYIKNK
jgi:hypothetical protein